MTSRSRIAGRLTAIVYSTSITTERSVYTSMQATEKQLNFIQAIQEYVDEEFTGSSIKEASDYISRNIENYKNKKSSLSRIKETELNKRNHITEETYNLAKSESGHALCPFCGGEPRLQEITVYKGRADHRWACTRYYYKNIICIKCKAQSGRTLTEEEYDDSDTIYPTKYNISDSDIWRIWDEVLKSKP